MASSLNNASKANRALWLPKAKGTFQVGDAPYTKPSAGKLVIRSGAWALNIIDSGMQSAGSMIAPWVKYPHVVGSDVAGEVVEVGDGVSRFAIGDRVVAIAMGVDKWSSGSPEGAYQSYVVVQENCCSAIPESMAYAEAAVLPMSVATASSGLFMPQFCGLNLPGKSAASPNREAVLVWGGSTSIGCSAIQLVKSAGYEVITTASPHNFEMVRSLGASHVFDYRSPTVKEDIIRLMKDKTCAGVLAVGGGSTNICIDIAGAVRGASKRKFVAQITAGSGALPPANGGLIATVKFVAQYFSDIASAWVNAKRQGVEVQFVWGTQLSQSEVGNAIFRDFLPQALRTGEFRPSPKPQVVGQGLEAVPDALRELSKGVSAKKLVVLAD